MTQGKEWADLCGERKAVRKDFVLRDVTCGCAHEKVEVATILFSGRTCEVPITMINALQWTTHFKIRRLMGEHGQQARTQFGGILTPATKTKFLERSQSEIRWAHCCDTKVLILSQVLPHLGTCPVQVGMGVTSAVKVQWTRMLIRSWDYVQTIILH